MGQPYNGGGVTQCTVHCCGHQVQHTPNVPSAAGSPPAPRPPPPPPPRGLPAGSSQTLRGWGLRATRRGGARHKDGNRAVTSPPHVGQAPSCRNAEPLYRGTGAWDRGAGAETWGADAQGTGQHSKAGHGSHTRGTRGTATGREGACEWEAVTTQGAPLASQSHRYRMPGQPLLNRHQVGGGSGSPDGLFARHGMEPTRGRPAVRGKGDDKGTPHRHQQPTHRRPCPPPPPPQGPSPPTQCAPSAPVHAREHHRLQHQEWDPRRYPAREPTMMAGGRGPEVHTTPVEMMKVRAMPTCTTGRGGVIGPHAHGNVVRQVAGDQDNA